MKDGTLGKNWVNKTVSSANKRLSDVCVYVGVHAYIREG